MRLSSPLTACLALRPPGGTAAAADPALSSTYPETRSHPATAHPGGHRPARLALPARWLDAGAAATACPTSRPLHHGHGRGAVALTPSRRSTSAPSSHALPHRPRIPAGATQVG